MANSAKITTGGATTASNLGGGQDVFAQKVNNDLQFNSISGVGAIEVSTLSNTIIVSGSAASGEQNTSSNLGSGEGLAAPKSGVNLPFKSVSGLSNIVLTSDANTVYFSGTINTTSDLPEGTNLYYTEARVDANSTVVQNTTDIATVSGISVQNQTDIATVSGIAIQNQTDIANVSGTAFSAVQNGTNLGNGDAIFSAKNGTNLEFKTVSGVGTVAITTDANVVTISGTGDGNGDVIGPASSTDNAIARYDGVTGKLLQDSSVLISDGDSMSGLVNLESTGYIQMSGIAPAATPPANNIRLYAKTDDQLYHKDDAGVETQITNAPDYTFAEQAPPPTPNTGFVVVYAKTDGLMYQKDDAGAETQLGGESNTASNLGNGEGLFTTKSGVDLPFKSVSGLSNIVLTNDANTVYFSGTINDTDDLPEGSTNLYYTDARVNANSTVVQNTTDIATVSGIAIQNQTDIANVSGTAFTAIQSASNIGGGDNIFSTKNGTDLEFRTVSGVGNISLTVEGNTVVFSGTGDGAGDVVGPTSATDNAVALYDGTTGKLIKDSTIIVDPAGTLNANVISGTTISGNNIYRNGSELNSTGLFDLTSSEVTQLQNIDSSTISTTQWGYLGSMDQGVATSDSVTFGTVNATVLSGTTISGNTVTENGNKVLAQREIVYVIDGGGSVISSGSKGVIQIPWDATVDSYRMVADASGNAQVDVRRQSYANFQGEGFAAGDSITGTETPTLTNEVKTEDTNLTTWSGISAGDNLEFRVIDDTTTITRITLNIPITPN